MLLTCLRWLVDMNDECALFAGERVKEGFVSCLKLLVVEQGEDLIGDLYTACRKDLSTICDI